MKSAYLVDKSQLNHLKKSADSIPLVTMRKQAYGKKEHELFIVTFSTEKNSLKDAHALSKVRDAIADPKLAIFDEGNLYYVRHLFASLSAFEQKLRGAIRLRLVPDDESHANLMGKLEEQTFGEYCTILFGDPDFAQQAKRIAGSKEHFNEKQYLLQLIGDLEYECLWDKHFEPEEMSTFRKRHHDIRNYRNDVMHVHFISREQYAKADSLLRKACNELDVFIDNLLEDAPNDSDSFASDLSRAFFSYSLLSFEISEAAKALSADGLYSSAIAKALGETSSLYADMFKGSSEAMAAATKEAYSQSLIDEALLPYKTSSYFEQLSGLMANAYTHGLLDATRNTFSGDDTSDDNADNENNPPNPDEPGFE